MHRFIEGKANYDLNTEINIFDIGNENDTVVSRSPGQRFTGSEVLG